MAITAIAALLRAPERDRWLLRAPVGLYAGWLTAATFVSLAAVLAGHGIALDDVRWAMVGIPAALLAALAVLGTRPRAWEYALAVGWALFGIAAKNGMELPVVTGLALGGILALAAVTWGGRWRPAA